MALVFHHSAPPVICPPQVTIGGVLPPLLSVAFPSLQNAAVLFCHPRPDHEAWFHFITCSMDFYSVFPIAGKCSFEWIIIAAEVFPKKSAVSFHPSSV